MTPLIDPAAFVAVMRAKWAEFGNVVSPALESVWAQIAEIMNQQATTPRLPRPVIPAELGAGKTTCAKLWCAMTPDGEAHPGVLVVLRTIEQVDEYVRDVNAWAGAPVALASHSSVVPKLTEAQIRTAPVLVICHMGYALSLDRLLVEEPEKYDRLMRFRVGTRRLVIVDEALDQVYVAQLERKDFPGVLNLHPRILSRHMPAVGVVQSVQRALLSAPDDGARVVSTAALLEHTSLTAADADAALVALWQDVRASKYVKPKERQAMLGVLTTLRRHLAAYRWTESEKQDRAIIGARLLLPPDAGQVHLDATGSLNNVYLSRPDAYAVQTMPPVRNYRAVTLYAALTRQGTGIWAMRRDGERIATETRDAVLAHYGDQVKHRRVLAVTNLESEDTVRKVWEPAGFAALAVAHWGAIDGRNDWRDFDTLVTITLPWARPSVDLSTHIALKGVEMTDEELSAPPDDIRAIRENRMAAEIAQAIGRLRLRRMVSLDGTCAPCDLFHRFPHNRDVSLHTDRVLAKIRQTLPGLRVLLWAAMSDERTPDGRPPTKRGAAHDALLAWAVALSPGERHVLTKGRQFSRMSWNRALADAQRDGHALHQALTKLGVHLEPGGYRAGVRGRAPAELVRQGAARI